MNINAETPKCDVSFGQSNNSAALHAMEIVASADIQALSADASAAAVEISTGNPIARDNGDIPTYHGEYEVTPSASSAIVLPTYGKYMADDVTVRKVPYYETSNLSGGKTAYIAMEV